VAPRIPFENDKRKPTGEDKFEAAIIATFIILLSIMGLTVIFSLLSALWHVGVINAVVIIGVFSGLFAIGRALYRTILEKDFS
jgi:hypothetical protein